MARANPYGHLEFVRSDDEATHPPVLTPEEARQGVISGRVIAVLVASLVLAVLAMVMTLGIYA